MRQLADRAGVPVVVSPILFEAVQFALAVAEDSDGAFDPTIGADLEARGFNEEYRSGAAVHSGVAPDASVSYRDVVLDAEQRTITLRRPLLLDLGGVAKGLAVDLASRELAPLEHFAIDAGGDLFLSGHNAADEPWADWDSPSTRGRAAARHVAAHQLRRLHVRRLRAAKRATGIISSTRARDDRPARSRASP